MHRIKAAYRTMYGIFMQLKVKYLIGFLVVLLTACHPDSINRPENTTPVESQNAKSQQDRMIYPRLATLPASREGDSSALQGTLYIKGSCIYAKAATSELYLIASMNPDIYWDDRQQSLVLSNVKLIKPGDPIMLGGSTYTGSQGGLKWTAAPDKSCDLSHIWIVSSIN